MMVGAGPRREAVKPSHGQLPLVNCRVCRTMSNG